MRVHVHLATYIDFPSSRRLPGLIRITAFRQRARFARSGAHICSDVLPSANPTTPSRFVAVLRALTRSRALADIPFIPSCDPPEEWPCFCLLLSTRSVVPLVSEMNGGLASPDYIMFVPPDCDFLFGLQHGLPTFVPTRARPTRRPGRRSLPLRCTQGMLLLPCSHFCVLTGLSAPAHTE